MIPFLLVLNERHLRAWMRKRPLKHTRLLMRFVASLCLEMLGGLSVSHDGQPRNNRNASSFGREASAPQRCPVP